MSHPFASFVLGYAALFVTAFFTVGRK